eukprot:696909-Rhodomonas_salina.1
MQEISVLRTQSILITEESEQNAVKSLKLWHSASILWGELYKENPFKFSFKQLKVGVAQGLSSSRFEPEPIDDYYNPAKRLHLNHSLQQAVAFSAEDLHDYAAQAFAAGAQSTVLSPHLQCWNCCEHRHPKALCPHPQQDFKLTNQFSSNCGSGFGFGGVRGARVGGVGGVGGVG